MADSIKKETELYKRMSVFVRTRKKGKEYKIVAGGKDILPLKSGIYYVALCMVV